MLGFILHQQFKGHISAFQAFTGEGRPQMLLQVSKIWKCSSLIGYICFFKLCIIILTNLGY